MSSMLVFASLALIMVLSPSLTQATHYDFFESALDTLLCPSAKKMPQTIIDIRKSIDRGASLIDGEWVQSLDVCLTRCCGMNNCDFALYKLEGSSSSGKNCYFVNCGDAQSNCVLVEHSGFTSIVMGGKSKEKASVEVTTQPPTPPTTSSHVTPTATTVTPSPTNQAVTTPTEKSNSETTNVPIPVSHTQNTSVPSDQKVTDSKLPEDKEGGVDNDTADKQANAPSSGGKDGGRQDGGVIAVVIVGVVCFTIIVIVVGVLAKKVWSDQRRKRFRNVDYLINGMYT